MTTNELLKEILKDSLFQEKYKIPKEVLENVSFDTNSGYPIIEAIKTIVQLKDSGVADNNVYRNIKSIFNIAD